MLWLLPVLVIGTGAVLRLLSHQVDAIYEEMTLQGAELEAHTIEEVRQIYASEVVERLKKHDIHATHDYASQDRAIPLPATLTMQIGDRLNKVREVAYVRLFSEYPFPNRSERKLDKFEIEAIPRMRVSSDDTFWQIEEFEKRPTFRLALADRMRNQNCVDCHNSHPDSPKRDWKLGDIRGVLEVIRPLDQKFAATHSALVYTINGTVFVDGFGLLGMLLLLQRMHRTSQKLRQTEARTRAIVSNAADGIVRIPTISCAFECNSSHRRTR